MSLSVLGGPFALCCALLVAGGIPELARPADTARALVAFGVPRVPRPVVRLGAAAEMSLGAVALLVSSRALAGLVAVAYLGFTAFVSLAMLRRLPMASCGCFGRPDTPPSVPHAVVTGVAAAFAGCVAVTGEGLAPLARFGHGPLLGLPWLLLVAAATYLAYLVLTALPPIWAEARSVHRGGHR